MNHSFCFPAVVTACLAAVGCSSQADTAYRGDPLAVFSGTVVTQSAAPPSTLYAALAWADPTFAPSPGSAELQSLNWVGQAAPVVGQFPADFTLDVYQPPPDSALESCSGGAHLALGLLVALDEAPVSGASVSSTVAGGAGGILVAYLDSDQTPGWICSPQTNGVSINPTKGYHLLQFEPNAQQFGGMNVPGFVEVPLSTAVTLTLGPLSLPDADGGADETPDVGVPTPPPGP
jgi:hypothetical protein